MIIAVDFDGTLCENRWPDIGPPREAVIVYLLERQRAGDKLILWTCREGELLYQAVTWALGQGIKFDAINANLPERIEKYGNDCRKIGADEYWDDKGVIVLPAENNQAEVIKPDNTMLLSVRKSVQHGFKDWFISKLKWRKKIWEDFP